MRRRGERPDRLSAINAGVRRCRRAWVAGADAGSAAGWVAADLPGRERGNQVELAGTELARSATAEGTVRETAGGVAITMRVSGLTAAALGTYYAAWLSAPDLEPVPVGSFHLRGGDQEVELWAGVDTAAYQTITVTLEPAAVRGRSSPRARRSGVPTAFTAWPAPSTTSAVPPDRGKETPSSLG
jgi:hypothetical protein